MNTLPVSILIPIRADTEAKIGYLAQCLDSCIKQGHPIVIDDGSPLSLAGLQSQYPDVVWDRISGGKSAARNRAVELATTELIFPLDADDALVPGAIQYLYDRWTGIPLYSNLIKWYTDKREVVHRLPTFSCDGIRHSSIAPVNVLHTKDMWRHVGGWPPGVQLYEDWEYNFRLLWLFGGERIEQPLVKYRQHANQSTNVLRPLRKVRLAQVLERIEAFIREEPDNMASCCGGKRRRGGASTPAATVKSSSAPVAASAHATSNPVDTAFYGTANLARLTTVDARYVGGVGRGTHTYRGPQTQKPYRVKAGVIVKAAAEDTRSEDEWRAGIGRQSLLVRINVAAPIVPSPVLAQAVPIPAPAPLPAPTPVEVVKPKAPPRPTTEYGDLSALSNEIGELTVKDILVNFKSWDDLYKYLEAEKRGKNRITVIKFLERQLQTAEG